MPDSERIAPQRLVSVLQRKPLTARRAALIIATFTLAVTVVGGVVAWLTDRSDFPSLGAGLWWSLQTVTTVGYGDLVPRSTGGRVIGALVMLSGIGFLTVITAAVTAALIETARRRAGGVSDRELSAQLNEISARLAVIEAGAGTSREPPEGPPG
jgi:voltage-gated potassium channel Kch